MTACRVQTGGAGAQPEQGGLSSAMTEETSNFLANFWIEAI